MKFKEFLNEGAIDMFSVFTMKPAQIKRAVKKLSEDEKTKIRFGIEANYSNAEISGCKLLQLVYNEVF